MGSEEKSFSDEPETQWLTDKKDPDRDMQLRADFYYTDPDKKTWYAKAEAVINGASIPRFLWSLVGSPYTRDYRRASIVHDIAVRGLKDTPERKKADVMFYYACRDGGCSYFESIVLYVGVRVGTWTSGQDEDDFDEFEYLAHHPKSMNQSSRRLQDEFKNIVSKLRKYEDCPDINEVDRLLEEIHGKLVDEGVLNQGTG